jgi:hypothetical protein
VILSSLECGIQRASLWSLVVLRKFAGHSFDLAVCAVYFYVAQIQSGVVGMRTFVNESQCCYLGGMLVKFL